MGGVGNERFRPSNASEAAGHNGPWPRAVSRICRSTVAEDAGDLGGEGTDLASSGLFEGLNHGRGLPGLACVLAGDEFVGHEFGLVVLEAGEDLVELGDGDLEGAELGELGEAGLGGAVGGAVAAGA